jgi:hypothetical protein
VYLDLGTGSWERKEGMHVKSMLKGPVGMAHAYILTTQEAEIERIVI